MILDQFPELKGLGARQRLQLAFEILEEIHDGDGEVFDGAILSILEQRREQFEAHPETAVRWEELRDRILSSRVPAAQNA